MRMEMKWMEGMEPKTEVEWWDYLRENIYQLICKEYPTTKEFLENVSDMTYFTIADDIMDLFMDVLKDCDMVKEEMEE